MNTTIATSMRCRWSGRRAASGPKVLGLVHPALEFVEDALEVGRKRAGEFQAGPLAPWPLTRDRLQAWAQTGVPGWQWAMRG